MALRSNVAAVALLGLVALGRVGGRDRISLWQDLEKNLGDPHEDEQAHLARLPAGPGDGDQLRREYVECPKNQSYARKDFRFASMIFYPGKDKRPISIEERKEEQAGGWYGDDIDDLVEKGFDPTRPSLVLMGGWMQNSDERWIAKFRENLDELQTANGDRVAPFNLLIYDWSRYGYAFYPTAVRHVDQAGAALAQFFERLIEEHKYTTDQIQFLSYSLSAHISGLAARRLKRKYGSPIRQITALDPTGVCFHDGSRLGARFGLRPDDAKLVVARHYNMHKLGAKRPIGGLDLFVNGGSSQPAMVADSWSAGDLADASGVNVFSHLRAVRHEVTKFDPAADCHELAYECSSYEAFMAGECGHCRRNNGSCFMINTLGNLRMGQRPNEINFAPATEMYLSTGRLSFCVHHYQVVARLHEDATKETIDSFKRGEFFFVLGDEKARPAHLVPGQQRGTIVFTQLMRPHELLGTSLPDRVPLKRIPGALLGALKSVAVRYLNHLSPETRRKYSAKYCPDWGSSEPRLVRCSSKPTGKKKREKIHSVT